MPLNWKLTSFYALKANLMCVYCMNSLFPTLKRNMSFLTSLLFSDQSDDAFDDLVAHLLEPDCVFTFRPFHRWNIAHNVASLWIVTLRLRCRCANENTPPAWHMRTEPGCVTSRPTATACIFSHGEYWRPLCLLDILHHFQSD